MDGRDWVPVLELSMVCDLYPQNQLKGLLIGAGFPEGIVVVGNSTSSEPRF